MWSALLFQESGQENNRPMPFGKEASTECMQTWNCVILCQERQVSSNQRLCTQIVKFQWCLGETTTATIS